MHHQPDQADVNDPVTWWDLVGVLTIYFVGRLLIEWYVRR